MRKNTVKTTEASEKRSWLTLCALIFAVAYSLMCYVLPYIIYELDSNILYSDTPIPTLLSYLRSLAELFAISFSYAVMICLLYRGEKGGTRPVFWLFLVSSVYKHLSNTVMTWIFAGSIPSSYIWDIADVVFFTALEFLQILVIYFVVKDVISRYKDSFAARQRVSADAAGAYPFKCIYDKGNCLLRSIYVCAIVTFVAKLGGALISDVWTMIAYGLPRENITWLLMLLNYASKLLFGAVTYIVVYVSVSKLLKSHK